MTPISGISLYNQDRLSDQNFIDNFVARQDVLEILLNGLCDIVQGGDVAHQIIVGSRGMGKSTLLRRVSIAIAEADLLSRVFIPLRFREEQYNVISLDAFWRNCGEALAEWCDANGHEKLAKILDQASVSAEWRNPDQAASAFLSLCEKAGGRPVLLLDNLDLILDELTTQECWALRRILQQQGGPVVIGAATNLLTQAGDRDAPFYEFFYPHFLEPLTENELLRCLNAMATLRYEASAHVRKILATEPERLRTLYALTGGNPRILAIIYQLLERGESSEIFTDLETLLDQVTPFYKARIEEYQTGQQRAVIDAIALNWDPITSGTISEVTGIAVTTISAQISRMKKVGFIEEVPTSGTRAGYQLAERFLNIWYLMRHGTRRTKQRLRWLAIFLTKLFTASELSKMAAEAMDNSCADKWHPHYRQAILEAFEMSDRESLPASGWRQEEYPSYLKPILLNNDNTTHWINEIKHLWNTDEDEEAITVYDDVITRFTNTTDPALLEYLAHTLLNMSFTLNEQGHREEEIAIYDEIITHLTDTTEPALLELLAIAFFHKSLTLGEMESDEEATTIYNIMISRLSNTTAPVLQEYLAKAFFNKGFTLSKLGRDEEAITIYDMMITHFTNTTNPVLLESLARALLNKGFTLGKLGYDEEAIITYDMMITHFTNATDPILLEFLSRALLNKGDALGHNEEAITIYDDIITRFANTTEPALQKSLANAHLNKGVTLGQLGRSEEAITAYDEVITRFTNTTDPVLLEYLARALVNKGVTLNTLGNNEEAIIIYDDIIVRFSNTTSPTLLEPLIKGFVNKGTTLGASLGRCEEAIVIYNEVIARFADTTAPILQEQLAIAMANKGIALSTLERNEESIISYDDMITRFEGTKEPALLEHIAKALLNKGILLKKLGHHEEAIAAYNKTIDSFSNTTHPALLETIARALINKGMALSTLRRNEEAIAVYDVMIDRFFNVTTLHIGVLIALVNKGRIFIDQIGPIERAIQTLQQGLAIDETSVWLKENLVWAYLIQGNLDAARTIRPELSELEEIGRVLINAGIEVLQDNIGTALKHLQHALDTGFESDNSNFFEDLLRLLRLVVLRDHGEKFITWFETSGFADRYAPLYGAFVAYVRGERFLLDLNPETRGSARQLYEIMDAPRRSGQTSPKTAKRRGRTRKGQR